MVKFVIVLFLSICAIILPMRTNDNVYADTTPIINSINVVQGSSPPGNVFNSLTSNTLWDISGGWINIYNYYSTNSLRYTYDGVETYNVDDTIDFPNGSHSYAIEFNFNTPILINNYRGFSMVFGGYGRFINVTSVDVGETNYNTINASFTYDEIDSLNYLLYFNYIGSLNIKFIRINFTADLSNIPIYDQFYKYIMYGLYNSVGGYVQGYQDGLDEGYYSGYDVGYDDGIIYSNNIVNNNSASYQAGYNAGVDDAGSLSELFSGVLQAPVKVVIDALDFEIFGINVNTFVLSLFTIGFIAIIVKLLL